MKETKVYVDELPESCKTCQFQCYGECRNGCDILKTDYSMTQCHIIRGKHKDCPLIDIKTHDRELVKEVCEKIRNAVNKSLEEIGGNCNGELYGQYICKGLVDYDSIEFDEILDQIQKEFEK